MDKKWSIYYDKVSEIIVAFSFEYKTYRVSEGGYYLDEFIEGFLAKAKREKRIVDYDVRSICAHHFENVRYGALFVAIYTEECGLETIAVDWEEEFE
jgi:hypothetical protein